jgi:hypothetical protein
LHVGLLYVLVRSYLEMELRERDRGLERRRRRVVVDLDDMGRRLETVDPFEVDPFVVERVHQGSSGRLPGYTDSVYLDTSSVHTHNGQQLERTALSSLLALLLALHRIEEPTDDQCISRCTVDMLESICSQSVPHP